MEALTDFLVAEVLRQRAKANRDRLALIIEQARRDNPNLTEAQLMAQVGALKVISGPTSPTSEKKNARPGSIPGRANPAARTDQGTRD